MQMDLIRYVIKKYEMDIPVIWMDRRLHNDVENLHRMIQKQINENQDAEEILLSYGLCGNAVLGLYSAETKLIFQLLMIVSVKCYTGRERESYRIVAYRKKDVII